MTKNELPELITTSEWLSGSNFHSEESQFFSLPCNIPDDFRRDLSDPQNNYLLCRAGFRSVRVVRKLELDCVNDKKEVVADEIRSVVPVCPRDPYFPGLILCLLAVLHTLCLFFELVDMSFSIAGTLLPVFSDPSNPSILSYRLLLPYPQNNLFLCHHPLRLHPLPSNWNCLGFITRPPYHYHFSSSIPNILPLHLLSLPFRIAVHLWNCHSNLRVHLPRRCTAPGALCLFFPFKLSHSRCVIHPPLSLLWSLPNGTIS